MAADDAIPVGLFRARVLAIGVMAIGMMFFFINMIYAFTAGKKAPANYWGEGATTLEWSLSSPPPFHQFSTLPVIEEHHSHHNAIGDASTAAAH